MALAPFKVWADSWPTHEFDITLTDGNPDHRSTQVWELLFPSDSDEAAIRQQIRSMERFLSDAARHFDSLGFRAPVHMPRSNGRYTVQLFDYEHNVPARAHQGDDVCQMQIDVSKAIDGEKLAARTMENLAHELFHCVQRAYPIYDDRRGDWLIEGSANAVGQDTAYLLRGVERRRSNPGGRWGARDYARPLAHRAMDYGTASFWRYLGEEKAARAKGGRAGVKEIAPDYSYLHDLFERGSRGITKEAESDWLDRGLEKQFGAGLERIYPNFVSTYAGYVPARANIGNTPARKARQKWWNASFDGGCEIHALSADAPTTETQLEIEPVAARCLTLALSEGERVDISFHVAAANRGALEQLSIGVTGGDRVAQPVIVSDPRLNADSHFAAWRFRVSGDGPQTFIISNVAERAGDTYPAAFTIGMTMSGWGSSMTKPRPEDPDRSGAGGAGGGTGGAKGKDSPAEEKNTGARPPGDPVREAAAEAVESGLGSLSARSASGMSVTIRDDNPGCDEPFRYRACGPVTRINLSLAPGAYGSPELAMGRGGLLGQMSAMIGGIEDMGTARSNKAMLARQREVASTEGARVNIAIPAIRYGFSGSFDNAEIKVSADEAGKFYLSRGPEDTDPTSRRQYPLNGRVTIEAFTPAVMRGRFSAVLTDESGLGPSPGRDAPLPVVDTIEGHFVIAAPWRGDGRIEMETGDVRETVLDDIADAYPGMAPMVEAVRDQVMDTPLPEPGDGGNSGGSGRAPETRPEPPADPALREAYRQHWIDQGVPASMMPDIMETFDEMSPRERRIMAESLGLDKGSGV